MALPRSPSHPAPLFVFLLPPSFLFSFLSLYRGMRGSMVRRVNVTTRYVNGVLGTRSARGPPTESVRAMVAAVYRSHSPAYPTQ